MVSRNRRRKQIHAKNQSSQAAVVPANVAAPLLNPPVDAGPSKAVVAVPHPPMQPVPQASTQLPPNRSGLLDDTDQFLRTVAFDVVDKQYKLYAWTDTKNQALITTNSLLFAAVGFLYRECLKDTLAMCLLGLGVLCIALSLIMCLTQVLPRISSGKSGQEPNTRSLRGISTYKSWEAYHEAFKDTTTSSIVRDTIRQIYGMANNNMRSSRIIKRGVYLTSFGVVMILVAIYSSALAARGYHIGGSWQIEVGNTVGTTNVAPPNVVTQSLNSSTGNLVAPTGLPNMFQTPASPTPSSPTLTNNINGVTNP